VKCKRDGFEEGKVSHPSHHAEFSLAVDRFLNLEEDHHSVAGGLRDSIFGFRGRTLLKQKKQSPVYASSTPIFDD
jgi:hypothetical protein